MKMCQACNSEEVLNSNDDYEDFLETMKKFDEEQQEESFQANAEAESGTTVHTYEEIFQLIKETISELVDNLKSGLDEHLNITNIKVYELKDKAADKLLEATFKSHKLLLMYETNGICDSPGESVEYDIEFLIDGESEIYYKLTHTNGEYEYLDGSCLPVIQDFLYADNNQTFINSIICKLENF